LKISIVTFGKLKNPGLKEAADYYKKLLTPWQSLNLIELKASHLANKTNPGQIELCKAQDEEIFLKALKTKTDPRAKVFLLDERGKSISSLSWSKIIQKAQDEATPELVFCTGPSLGFTDRCRALASGLISFGSQTLSHELIQIVLIEQLYRAHSILKGHPYHNG
jgi:23S rRNA (pseudouridine1915-N3)-methyltransferase